MTNPTKCCAECKYIGLPEAFGKPHAECPCHKQESWEVEFDNLRRQYSFQVMPWAKQFIRETLQKERERVVGILEGQMEKLRQQMWDEQLQGKDLDERKDAKFFVLRRVLAEITKNYG